MADVIDPSSDAYGVTYRISEIVTNSAGLQSQIRAELTVPVTFSFPGGPSQPPLIAQNMVDALSALAQSMYASLGVATPVDVTVYEDRPNTATVTAS